LRRWVLRLQSRLPGRLWCGGCIWIWPDCRLHRRRRWRSFGMIPRGVIPDLSSGCWRRRILGNGRLRTGLI